MNTRTTIRLTAVVLFITGLLLTTTTASASKQALVRLEYKQHVFVPSYIFYSRTAIGTVTVNTTTTPTPSVMIPASLVAGASTFSFTGYYTPLQSNMTSWMNLAATLAKSHGGAAPSGGSVLLPITGMGGVGPSGYTTKCFASISPVAPGPPNLPGSCFPRLGLGMRSPGAKKFGGTARMVRSGRILGTFIAFSPTGLDLFDIDVAYTPVLSGPSAVGNYGIFGTGTFTNTVLATARRTMLIQSSAPFTTGVATAGAGDFGSQVILSGSNSFNTGDLTGMISMVQPAFRNQFSRNQAGIFIGRTLSINPVRSVTLTFAGEVPEPGSALMLGFGALGLGGLMFTRRS